MPAALQNSKEGFDLRRAPFIWAGNCVPLHDERMRNVTSPKDERGEEAIGIKKKKKVALERLKLILHFKFLGYKLNRFHALSMRRMGPFKLESFFKLSYSYQI